MTVSDREKEVLDFWGKDLIFKKSVSERPEGKPFVFYDGPPFATGLPHYGHLPSSFLKDAFPRYYTMKGYRVDRVWGWDCHGLPIENIIEEKLQLKSKKDIEAYGIEKFNEQCRATVLTYAEEWKKTIHRIGRWVDMENAYKTMDPSFMESVWWVFGELWKKGLIYEGKKAMHVCPRCETPLSNFEVTQGYKEVTDLTATVQFKLLDAKEKLGIPGDVTLLAWTTTPWTLPGNVLLAVGAEIKYIQLQHKETGAIVIMALDRWSSYAEKIDASNYIQLDGPIKGSDLAGLTYEPLFPYFSSTKNAFRIVTADFVTTEDGTGVVHIAPAFGEDDYQLGQREDVEFVQHVAMNGKFIDAVTDFSGQEVKPKDDPLRTDIEMIKWLSTHGKLFHKEKYVHSYPHCWRCDTPLLNYATSSWYVSVTKIKDAMLSNNEKTSWIPAHMRDGRFGKWLEGARDWAISRDRYWGAPLPVWKNDDGDVIVVASADELEKLSGTRVTDFHKHVVDAVTFEKEGKVYTRIPQVLDCWFESGSMPYGQMHYPFENKERFERGFPAEFIAEGQDQTRGWFYVLHVLATALTTGKNPSIPVKESTPAFKHVVVNGIVLAEDGKKMAKRLKNYPDISKVIEAFGADALRFYILSSPVVHAENMNFSENGVRELYNKYVNTLWNVFVFFEQQSARENRKAVPAIPQNPSMLDRWILSRLATTAAAVTKGMEEYDIIESCRALGILVGDLSQWYVRRSRERLKGDDESDGEACAETLEYILYSVSLLSAPITPFIAESIYRGMREWNGKALSVHLETWPTIPAALIDEALNKEMDCVRSLVEMGHALRSEGKLKVRQPLSRMYVSQYINGDAQSLLADEVNMKEIVCGPIPVNASLLSKEQNGLTVALDLVLTPELKAEGLLRELVRQINAQRKERGLTRNDLVDILYETSDIELSEVIEVYAEQLKKSVLAKKIEKRKIDQSIELSIDGKTIFIGLNLVP